MRGHAGSKSSVYILSIYTVVGIAGVLRTPRDMPAVGMDKCVYTNRSKAHADIVLLVATGYNGLLGITVTNLQELLYFVRLLIRVQHSNTHYLQAFSHTSTQSGL